MEWIRRKSIIISYFTFFVVALSERTERVKK